MTKRYMRTKRPGSRLSLAGLAPFVERDRVRESLIDIVLEGDAAKSGSSFGPVVEVIGHQDVYTHGHIAHNMSTTESRVKAKRWAR
jgi:hypothetical protein